MAKEISKDSKKPKLKTIAFYVLVCIVLFNFLDFSVAIFGTLLSKLDKLWKVIVITELTYFISISSFAIVVIKKNSLIALFVTHKIAYKYWRKCYCQNVLICLSTSILYSITNLFRESNSKEEAFFLHGYVFDSKWWYFFKFIRMVLVDLINPSWTCILTNMYCRLCFSMAIKIKKLCRLIVTRTPETFTEQQQMKFLLEKSKTFTSLNEFETATALPIFLVFITNFWVSFSIVGTLTVEEEQTRTAGIILDNFLCVSFALLSLVVIILSGSHVTAKIEEMNCLFWKQIELRVLIGLDAENSKAVKEVMMNSQKSLSLYGIIHFKKKTVLALIGTILTYSLLLMGTK